jgi:hypothetical protein
MYAFDQEFLKTFKSEREFKRFVWDWAPKEGCRATAASPKEERKSAKCGNLSIEDNFAAQ